MENLNAIRVFTRVAETRSFTEAGKRLGISASGISKAISRLEEELGVKLLNRTTRTVSLTADGASLFERCRQILTEIEDAETAVTRTRSAVRGKLRVQMPLAFGRLVIVPALAEFIKRYPELVVDVELSDRQVDLAEEGLDTVVHIGELRDSRMIARKLCDIRFVTCASPEYLSRHGEPETPDELAKHRCLGYILPRIGRYRDWHFSQNGTQISKTISGHLNLNSAEALLDAAIAGAGIAATGTFVAANAIAAGKLKVILRDYIAVGPQVSVVYLPSRHLSPRVQAFVDFLTHIVPLSPAWDRVLVGNE